MNKYFTTLQNERGDVLPNYRAQVVDSTGSTVTIYSDKSGTRFTDASGNIVNYATASANGRVSFYFEAAEGQVLQTLDAAGDLVDSEPDFADNFILANLPGNIAQSAVTGLTTDLAAKTATADLASSDAGKGAALVGFKQSGTGAVSRTVEAKTKETISVKDFGAVGDNVTDDTAAIQAALNHICSVGGVLFFPIGTYLITTALTVDSTLSVFLVGEGRDSTIRQTGAGQTGLIVSTTTNFINSGIKNLQIRCLATSGPCIEFGHGAEQCEFDDLNLVQANLSEQIWRGNFDTLNTGGIIGCRFRGGVWTYTSNASTVHPVEITCHGQLFNENLFEGVVCYFATAKQFFNITSSGTATLAWLENNSFRNLWFQGCGGGAFRFDNANKWLFEGIRMWDLASYTNHIFEMLAIGTAGVENKAVTISNYGRMGGSLSAGKYDVYIAGGQDTILNNIGMESSHSPVWDFGSKRVTVIGRAIGTFSNDTNALFLGNSTGAIRFPGTVNKTYLSYYDEGTWTGTLTGTGAGPTTPVTATGQWTRIGRKVHVSIEFSSVDTTGAVGNITVTGLPFAANATYTPVGVTHMVGLGSIASIARAASTSITLYRVTSATAITHADGAAGAGKTLRVSMEYIV